MGRVLVLGCGPAGLLAAHAGKLAGHKVSIISKKVKSRIGGAQYLHHEIPELTPEEPQGWLTVHAVGSREGYATKVYGDPEAEVSWDLFVGKLNLPVWDIVDLYNHMWEEWESKVMDASISAGLLNEGFVLGGWATFDFIISTIPVPAICTKRTHIYTDQRVVVSPVWYGDKYGPMRDDRQGLHIITYNGSPNDAWYRSSWIFGRAMTEWSMTGVKDPESMFEDRDRKLVIKPLSTDCTCWPMIIRAGRYGKWSKGDLVTDAFDEVFNAVS